MADMPDEITLRFPYGYGSVVMIAEINGKPVQSQKFNEPGDPQEPGNYCKAAEIALRAAGYVPDLDGMYIDMNLFVLKFRRKTDE